MMTKQRTNYDRDYKQKLVELSHAKGNAKKEAEEYGVSKKRSKRIRTPGAPKSTTVFETAPFDHSGISPSPKNNYFYKMKMIRVSRIITFLIFLLGMQGTAFTQDSTVKK